MVINFVISNSGLEFHKSNKKSPHPKLNLLQEHLHFNNIEEDRNGSDYRPDLVHFCLLSLQDSILNKEGKIQVYLETLQGHVFKVSNSFRVPRAFKVFNKVFSTFLHSKSKDLRTESGDILIESVVNLDQLIPDSSIKIAIDNRCPVLDIRAVLSQLTVDFDRCWFFFSSSQNRNLSNITLSNNVEIKAIHKELLERDDLTTSTYPNKLQSLEDKYFKSVNNLDPSNHSNSVNIVNGVDSKFDYCLSIRDYNMSCLSNCYTLVCTLEHLLNY
ncbi:EMG1/NEP1 methyltransferase family protein [Theileria parva strain Muguga]|uniref:Ribosome biogenesis protein n=1 Tax=Theileria parva TaxID=5875 RepID=Q4MZ72_THEPA|nr:EMG1/NEP1 methyltransferase family protein [Theileria parva strain Muguga]EAN30460.1 EMG1/NEP1 methyltransferase family protein [Theileria parva strain Muguga]|eukprot:XP_762743.1 hypothetical protein [Theileria parva strain Muguga]